MVLNRQKGGVKDPKVNVDFVGRKVAALAVAPPGSIIRAESD
jgi:hypothetical protein